jgi:hypothetical protein
MSAIMVVVATTAGLAPEVSDEAPGPQELSPKAASTRERRLYKGFTRRVLVWANLVGKQQSCFPPQVVSVMI